MSVIPLPPAQLVAPRRSAGSADAKLRHSRLVAYSLWSNASTGRRAAERGDLDAAGDAIATLQSIGRFAPAPGYRARARQAAADIAKAIGRTLPLDLA